jgi:phosphohistidine swiveling domain-containing protein
VIALEQAAAAPIEAVGAKARSLAAALAAGFRVPPGVVLPPGEEPEPDRMVEALGSGPFAVRSSSPAEDGTELSWAGQFTSLLPVEATALEQAVAEVRASGSNARASAYGGAGEPIPALVQPVVPALAAGIAFSLDPADGDERFCVIESVAGLGSSLAEGTVTPHRLRIEIESGEVDGTIEGALADTGARSEVVDLLLRVSDWLGRPCDVEWAWDGEHAWLLQARPVTAASWRPADGQWTSANVGETMPGIVSPLASSVILEDEFARSIDSFLQQLGIARHDEEVVQGRRFYGHAYWRVDRIKERMLLLPGFVERKADESMGIAPTYDGDGRRSALTPRTVARGIPAGRAMWRMYRTEGERAQRHAATLEAAEPDWLGLDWDALDEAELAVTVGSARELHRETNLHAITVNFLAEQAQDIVRELLEIVGRKLRPEPDPRLLLAGVGPIPTAAATGALEDLARRHGHERDAIVAADGPDQLPEPVRVEFARVVDRFGWMAAADDELCLPRWDEEPDLPLALFKAAVRAGPEAAEQGDFAARRDAEEARVLGAVHLSRPLVRGALRLARRYQSLREELRVTVARANRIARRAFLAAGRRAAANGELDQPGDVFWLTYEEVERLGTRELVRPARGAVTTRRAHARRFRNWHPPNLLGAAPRTERTPGANERELAGVACSWGVARGRVKVLHRLEDIDAVAPGAVLVLRHANPGWTPAFVIASALVTEEGGLLSHSSVIARERGLPTVINVPDVTERLRDGQLVEVDGGRGTVTVVDAAGER